MMPTSNANAKSWIIPPPSINRAKTTTRVVPEVSKVRLSVSFTLLLIMNSRGFLWYFLEFSRILSKTMMVSFNEYPMMVSRAAMIGRVNSLSKTEKIPTVIIPQVYSSDLCQINHLLHDQTVLEAAYLERQLQSVNCKFYANLLSIHNLTSSLKGKMIFNH